MEVVNVDGNGNARRVGYYTKASGLNFNANAVDACLFELIGIGACGDLSQMVFPGRRMSHVDSVSSLSGARVQVVLLPKRPFLWFTDGAAIADAATGRLAEGAVTGHPTFCFRPDPEQGEERDVGMLVEMLEEAATALGFSYTLHVPPGYSLSDGEPSEETATALLAAQIASGKVRRAPCSGWHGVGRGWAVFGGGHGAVPGAGDGGAGGALGPEPAVPGDGVRLHRPPPRQCQRRAPQLHHAPQHRRLVPVSADPRSHHSGCP